MAKVTEKEINVKGKQVSIGIDIHKQSWHVTAVAEAQELLSATIPPQYQSLKKLFARFKGARIQVAYEAGFSGFGLYDQITAEAIDCIVTPPSLLPTESGNRVKTDRRDSRKLAWYLDKGLLKRVWVLSAEHREHRQLVRTRRQIVEHRCDVMRQIKSLLMFHGIEVPPGVSQSWSRRFIAWLSTVGCSEYIRCCLNVFVELYRHLTEQVKQLTRAIIELSGSEKYAQRVSLLRSIPGIGILSAMELLLELQEVDRFTRADQLAAYIGLTPSQYSSGEHIRMGRLTHSGNHRLRTLLVESSWILIGKDAGLRKRYEAIKQRRGGKRAIVGIARRLIIRIRRMLLHSEPYRMELPKAA